MPMCALVLRMCVLSMKAIDQSLPDIPAAEALLPLTSAAERRRGPYNLFERQSLYNLNFTAMVAKEAAVVEPDTSLSIYNVQPSDEGVYRCQINGDVGGIVILEVVDQKEYTVVKPPTSHGPYSSPPQTIKDLIVFTMWSEWSECSTCGKVGRKRRYGICYIKSNTKENKRTGTEKNAADIDDIDNNKDKSKNNSDPKKNTTAAFKNKDFTDFGKSIAQKKMTADIEDATTDIETDSELTTEFSGIVEKDSEDANKDNDIRTYGDLEMTMPSDNAETKLTSEGGKVSTKFDGESNDYINEVTNDSEYTKEDTTEETKTKDYDENAGKIRRRVTKREGTPCVEGNAYLQEFPDGVPCRSKHLPMCLRDLDKVINRTNEIMIAMCKVPCQVTIYEKQGPNGVIESANNSAGIYSLDQSPPRVVEPTREIVFVTRGRPTTVRCPGTTLHDIPLSWRVGNQAVVPRELYVASDGRVRLDARDQIVFTAVWDDDAGLYSCWQADILAGTVRLVVWSGADWANIHMKLFLAVLVAFMGLVVAKRSLRRKRIRAGLLQRD